MNRTLFSGLIILTLIAVIVAVTLSRETAHNGQQPTGLLLPQLAEQVNDIEWVRVTSGGETVATANRQDGYWVVEEAGGYRADWPKLQALLSGLASAQVVEPKTANPDYYERLGVADPSQAGSTGVLVEFAPSSGLPAVVIGNEARGRGGQYLRLADGGQAVLVDREFDVETTVEGWIDRAIVDIAEDEVVEVAITQADGNVVLARKVSADDENFVLQGVPDGMKPKSEWTVNSLAGAFAGLQADEVRPLDEIGWSDAVRYRLVTADGLMVEARAVSVDAGESADEAYWLQLEAGVYTTALDHAADEESEATTSGRAAEINERTRGWAYRVPKYHYDTMTKTMDELLESAAEQP